MTLLTPQLKHKNRLFRKAHGGASQHLYRKRSRRTTAVLTLLVPKEEDETLWESSPRPCGSQSDGYLTGLERPCTLA